jgi:lipopolysaccharide export system permease protein
MKILDIYLLRRYLSCLFFSVLSLLLLSIVVDLIETIDLFIDFGAKLGQILAYYLYRSPYWVILTLPIATLLATMFSLTSFARSNEITAIKAAGVSLQRLLLPIFIFALLFSGLAFLLTDYVVPRATYHYNSIRNEIRSYNRSDGSRRQVLLQDVDGQLIFARSYDAGKKRAHEVSWEKLRDYKTTDRMVARYLEWRQDRWILLQGRHYAYAATGATQISVFDSLELPSLTLLPQDFAHQQKKPEEMSYGELEAYIDRARANGEDVARRLVDLHLKISFPFTCFIIVVLGAPLAANARRAGLANSFGLGALICFSYYSLVKAGQALGWNQVVAPLAGAWLGNMVFGILCLILLWRAHK